MNIEEVIGPSWRLGPVVATLMPGPSVGAPTWQQVVVTLDYHPGGRPELHDGVGAWSTGPHLTFTGEGDSIEDALAVALGKGRAHQSVQRYGSEIPHAAKEASR